mmetsp:Transcript_17402/g.20883  ORF Transcript_17402/g.20883 Transcript_17402/m.20883 type:complete len:251 (+) Transcript_17402:426-1178(+)
MQDFFRSSLTSAGMSQKGVGCAQYMCSLSSHLPVSMCSFQRLPTVPTAPNIFETDSTVAMTSVPIASLTKVGCPLRCSFTTEAAPVMIATSARHKSQTNSNPALSTTMSTLLPPSSRASNSTCDTRFRSSCIKYFSPAARAELKASPARLLAVPSSGHRERSMRFPQRAVSTKSSMISRITSSSIARDCSAASLFSLSMVPSASRPLVIPANCLHRFSTAASADFSPRSFCFLKGSSLNSKYFIASTTRL